VFSEYQHLVEQLKAADPHFKQLFDKHDALDERIRNMETHVEHATHEQIETLKKEKLLLKDQVWAILNKARTQKA